MVEFALDNLIKSIPQRVRAVIAARDAATRFRQNKDSSQIFQID